MVRPVETLTERTLLEEGIIEKLGRVEDGKRLRAWGIAPGVKLRVGPGQAELVARRILAVPEELGPAATPESVNERLVVDPSLEPHEWAPVWEGRPADA